MKPRILIDENLSLEIGEGVRQHNPAIDILHVGSGGGAPANGTIDPDILGYCEQERRILITKNRKSMPGHVADHVRSGHEFWGLLTIKRGRQDDIGGLVESLILIWETQEAEEYLGVQTWIPL